MPLKEDLGYVVELELLLILFFFFLDRKGELNYIRRNVSIHILGSKIRHAIREVSDPESPNQRKRLHMSHVMGNFITTPFCIRPR